MLADGFPWGQGKQSQDLKNNFFEKKTKGFLVNSIHPFWVGLPLVLVKCLRLCVSRQPYRWLPKGIQDFRDQSDRGGRFHDKLGDAGLRFQ